MISRLGRSVFAGFAVTVLSILNSHSAMGQEASSTRGPSIALEEVLVTAERREESIQDLAFSVRALSGEELQRLSAVKIEDYADFVPGLNIVESLTGATQIEMRGVSIGAMRDDRPEFRPTVGVYLDEAPIAAQTIDANILLMDLERIEVMRGPQPILYGAGSLSGAVRMITRKPELAEFEGKLGVGSAYTEHGSGNFNFDGIVNVPLIKDELAIRGVGFYREDAGYIDNPQLAEENVNDIRTVGGRLALRFEPTDYFRLNGALGYQDSHSDSLSEYYVEAGELNSQNVLPTPQDSELILASLVADVDFNVATLTSATSFINNDFVYDREASLFSDFVTGTAFIGENDHLLNVYITFFKLEEFTQEIRLVSKDEGTVKWIAGMLFQQQNHNFGQDLPVPGLDAYTGIPSSTYGVEPDNAFKSRVDLETKQISLFGEASVTLFDKLTLKGGLRWFDATQDSSTLFAGALSAAANESAKHSESGINPTVNLSYQIDEDRMLYVQAARGFRLGGTNEPIPEALCGADLAAAGFTESPDSFDSDTLWSYEAGLKSTWLDKRLRVNAAGYLINWQDAPIAVAFACGFSTIINVGEYDISGAEVDVEATLLEGLISRLGVSYTDSKLGEAAPLVNGVKGDRAPYTPEFTISFSLDYDFPISALVPNGMGFVHGDVRWVDERITNFPLNPGIQGVFDLSPYSEGNLRFGIYSDTWEVAMYVTNLWDERPEITKQTWLFSELPGTIIVTSRPRTFGLQVSRNF